MPCPLSRWAAHASPRRRSGLGPDRQERRRSHDLYGERNSVRAHGDALRVRLLFDYAQMQQDPDTLIEHRSMIEIASVDCRGRRLAAIEATSYARNMGKGRAVVVNEQAPDTALRYVKAAPASIDDRVVTFACSRPAARVSASRRGSANRRTIPRPSSGRCSASSACQRRNPRSKPPTWRW